MYLHRRKNASVGSESFTDRDPSFRGEDCFDVLEETRIRLFLNNEVVVCKCLWYDNVRGAKSAKGATILKSERLSFGNEVYVYLSQVKQFFYVDDPRNLKWNIAILISPRDIYNTPKTVMDDDDA